MRWELLSEIVRLIRQKKADYVLTLKSNHPTLYSQVQKWFDAAKAKNFESITVSPSCRVEKGHHRREKRLVWAVPLAEFGGLYKQEQWLGLQSIVMIQRTRHLWNKVTHEVHFYLSSLPAEAHVLGNAIRTHWGIENQVHWTLDVTFNEDQSRIRSCHSPRNFALLRPMALNALNLEKTLKRPAPRLPSAPLRQKSRRASMNNDYMMTVLQSFCQ